MRKAGAYAPAFLINNVLAVCVDAADGDVVHGEGIPAEEGQIRTGEPLSIRVFPAVDAGNAIGELSTGHVRDRHQSPLVNLAAESELLGLICAADD